VPFGMEEMIRADAQVDHIPGLHEPFHPGTMQTVRPCPPRALTTLFHL
jgi:hypothetical protein